MNGRTIKPDNVTVHRAAANDIDFKTRAARGSVCNGWLSAVVSSQRLLGEDASQHSAAYRTQRPKKRSQHVPCGE